LAQLDVTQTNVEQRLQGWGVTVQASDPYVPGTLSLDDLLRTSDVVSLHVVLTRETRNMIGPRELALMKPSAILVNTSRGGAVVEEALAEAIDAGRLAGAALDVFQQEPIDMSNPLLHCDPDRVILTPHSIGHNLETGPTGVQMAFDNIDRALRGEPPPIAVTLPNDPRLHVTVRAHDLRDYEQLTTEPTDEHEPAERATKP